MRLTDLFENNRITIFETGDAPFPYSLSFQTSNLYTWEFRPTEKLDIKYEVTFQRGGLAKYPRTWSMEFGTFGPDRPLHDPYALNNLAKNKIVSATRLFSTIYNILLDFIKAESATEIMFSAKEPVRIESYKNIVPKLARRLGWQYQILPGQVWQYQVSPDQARHSAEELTLFRIFNNGELLEDPQ